MSLRLSLLAVLVLCACDRPVVYRDYPVIFDGDKVEPWQDQTPRLVAGVYREQLFAPLAQGDHLDIIHGFQGGVWVHLSVRTFGMPGEGTLAASLDPDVGSTELLLRMTRSPEGFQEAYDIPIPVAARGPDLDALDGTEARLAVSFTAEDRSVSDSLIVTLAAP